MKYLFLWLMSEWNASKRNMDWILSYCRIEVSIVCSFSKTLSILVTCLFKIYVVRTVFLCVIYLLIFVWIQFSFLIEAKEPGRALTFAVLWRGWPARIHCCSTWNAVIINQTNIQPIFNLKWGYQTNIQPTTIRRAARDL